MFLWIYLGIYLALVVGAFVTLWVGGVFAYISPIYLLLAFVVALGLGALLVLVWRWRPGVQPRA